MRKLPVSLFVLVILSGVVIMKRHAVEKLPSKGEPVMNATEFKIVAQYGQGDSPLKPWVLTIAGDGKAMRQVGEDGAAARLIKTLSPVEIETLKKKIHESRFFDLKKEYDAPVTDEATLILTIDHNGKSHQTSVYAPMELKKDSEVQRFFSIWRELLTIVPSPNPEDKPERYAPR